ncbi:MAG: type II toxin-antitoxin system VapC family toxin [Fibrella sp.]|nr:type II toxin-antitoxin system VapC family toxin [Armatimonadota bacterium]
MRLLDTDTFSEYLREKLYKEETSPVTNRIARAEPGSVVISVVTMSEMMKGMLNLLQRFEKAGRTETGFSEMFRVYESWGLLPVLPYDVAADAYFTGFPPAVRRVGRPDCQIAAIALANRCVVVTRNTRHFAQIPGITCEDWTRTSVG